jgi:uncharacterized protein (DUF1800 family)
MGGVSTVRRVLPQISRRAALGVAVAGGAGVAAARLLAPQLQGLLQRATAGSGSGWASPLADERARVAHLLRRATFGATPQELEAAQSDGFQKTLDRLLDSAPAQPPDYFAGSPASSLNPGRLQLWWIRHMLATPTPLAERMTLFWHGHFTSDYRKVGVQTPFIYWQNRTWRRMAITDLKSMLLEVTRDPAMLRYLDLATSTGANPNENYARELMELFTMGLHYTEDDVRAAAKALAGWTEPPPDGSTQVTLDKANNVTRRYGTWQTQKAGVFVARRAYHGPPVKLLGSTRRWDTQQVIDQILAQPSTATFIAGKLAAEFVSAPPDPRYVARLADTFKAGRYDFNNLLRAIFTSPEFLAADSYRALVKSPTEFMVHVLKALQAPQLAPLAVASARTMGQELFDPPDVGGWPSNEAWISSNTVVARVNFVTEAVDKLKRLPPADQAAAQHLDGVLSGSTAGLLGKAADDARRWLLLLASPEFQLK